MQRWISVPVRPPQIRLLHRELFELRRLQASHSAHPESDSRARHFHFFEVAEPPSMVPPLFAEPLDLNVGLAAVLALGSVVITFRSPISTGPVAVSVTSCQIPVSRSRDSRNPIPSSAAAKVGPSSTSTPPFSPGPALSDCSCAMPGCGGGETRTADAFIPAATSPVTSNIPRSNRLERAQLLAVHPDLGRRNLLPQKSASVARPRTATGVLNSGRRSQSGFDLTRAVYTDIIHKVYTSTRSTGSEDHAVVDHRRQHRARHRCYHPTFVGKACLRNLTSQCLDLGRRRHSLHRPEFPDGLSPFNSQCRICRARSFRHGFARSSPLPRGNVAWLLRRAVSSLPACLHWPVRGPLFICSQVEVRLGIGHGLYLLRGQRHTIDLQRPDLPPKWLFATSGNGAGAISRTGTTAPCASVDAATCLPSAYRTTCSPLLTAAAMCHFPASSA